MEQKPPFDKKRRSVIQNRILPKHYSQLFTKQRLGWEESVHVRVYL